ncbi:MAG: FG-GAP-like repeat-containing protein [Acidobacteriota bacterium]
MRLKLSLAMIALFLTSNAFAATFIVPTDDELVRKSSAILAGTVEGSYVQEANGTVETVYEIRAERGYKGIVKRDELVRVVALGGVIGERGVLVPGEARYEQGERVLVFLTKDNQGRWHTTDLTLGRFKFTTSTKGDKVLVRDTEDVVGWNQAGQVHQEKVRREEGFLRFVEERAKGRTAATDYEVDASAVTVAPEPSRLTAAANATSYPAASYTDYVSNQPVRWPNNAAGLNYYKRVDQNISGAADGGVSVIQGALAAWTNECGSVIVMNYAGTINKASTNYDSTNVVEFNDPQGRISGSWTGSGTVGIAFLSFSGTHTFQGQSWLNITDGDVVFQDGFPATNSAFKSAMTHELGHTLGWRHSNQDRITGGACDSSVEECTSAAIMNSSVSANYGFTLQPWDINAAQSVYPGGTCGTPPPTCTAPAITTQPTSRTITSGSSTTLTVAASGTTPLTYQWYVGSPTSTTTPVGTNSSSLTVSPTSTTTYWVRVTNSCGTANSAGATVTVSTTPPPTVRNRKRADFDGDGLSELLWRNSSNQLAMWDLNGRTIVTSGVFASVPSSSWRIEGYGDFNTDGKYDLLVRNTSTQQIAVWAMSGRTILSQNVITTLADARWNFEAFGDFTGDGRTDVIARHSSSGEVALWELNTTQLLNSGVVATVGDTNWVIQGGSDFTGDGKDELLWRNNASHQLSMWDFSGRTPNTNGLFATVDFTWKVQGMGDFTGDGRADILWRSQTNSVVIWEMNGRSIVSKNVIATVNAASRFDAIGDFNGDGDDEIILFNTTTGEVAMWEIANRALANGGVFNSVPLEWRLQPPFSPVR